MQAPTPDTRIADAINRVLETEQMAAHAVAAAQAAAQARIEAARETRRLLLETARQRIVRLHERAQGTLNARLAALDREHPTAPHDEAAMKAIAAQALEAIAVGLTSDEPA
jgi:hypothetical protein